jgi:hypothetical protein
MPTGGTHTSKVDAAQRGLNYWLLTKVIEDLNSFT